MHHDVGGLSEAQGDLPRLVCVAHGGPLEAKSALLLCSLSDYYIGRRILCRQVVPETRWGALSREFLQLCSRLSVEVAPVENRIDLGYPHGNKIGSLDGVRGPAIFLDSDMLLICPFSWHYKLGFDAALKPADLDTFERGGGDWKHVYELFAMKMPRRTDLSSVRREPMRPYFNAGFISVKDGQSFSEVWFDTATQIDRDGAVRNKRPWLDQIALPVTFRRLGWRVERLGEAFNFPCHLTDIGDSVPYFAHYHQPEVIVRSAALFRRFKQVLRNHPELFGILGRFAEWRDVLEACSPLRAAGAGLTPTADVPPPERRPVAA